MTSEGFTTGLLSKMGAKVRALLDTAESYRKEGNEEAADSYQAKADALMLKYRIEQEQVLAVDPTAVVPVNIETDLVGWGSPYRTQYHHLWWYIAHHTGIKTHVKNVYTESGYKLRAYAVGYEEDVRYAEMLFTDARYVFQDKLEPKIDRNLSDQVNAYRLRSAGIERIRIADMLWGNTDKVFLGRVGRLYQAECKERGEEALLSGRGVTGKAYREQYSAQFVETFRYRLMKARHAATATGGGIVLHGRAERVQEAYYTFYPDQRPAPALPAGEEAAKCEKCEKSKRGACRDHYLPMGRGSKGTDPYSIAAVRGRMAGENAANAVQVGRSAGRQELS